MTRIPRPWRALVHTLTMRASWVRLYLFLESLSMSFILKKFSVVSETQRQPALRRILSWGLLGLAAMALTPARAAPLPKLAALAHSGAIVTALVTDLDNGQVIASLNPRQRVTPASLTKLVVTAAAYSHWHTHHTFKTRLLATGPISDGHLRGDLILLGDGDPSLDSADLWTLAAQLKGAGITAVDGNLVVAPAPFGLIACETQDRCTALDHSDTAYNAEVSSIGINYGNWCVSLTPTQPGRPARVGACHSVRLPIPVIGTITTVAANRRPTYTIERRTSADGDSLHVSGDVPLSPPINFHRAMSNPALGTGLTLAEMLRDLGTSLRGHVVLGLPSAAAAATQVAMVESAALRVHLDNMLRFSNNYIADVLTLDLASDENRANPPTSLSQAGHQLADFVAVSNHRRGQQASLTPTLDSGSGLTPTNLLSAQDLVNLLTNMYHDPGRFSVFYGGLEVPRYSPSRSLHLGNADWLDRVALKTGTLSVPHSAFGISGYLRKKTGGWMAFAMIVNGGGKNQHIPRYKALEAARTDLQGILATY
ncbi:MAG: D-alanyl-D-alanine carboxypeptidase/D-alanyl-D-alanine-endopeptidase [Nevskiaceae bacterium]|nr:MAG: D-alanyl-D-alanine carboxypeptidase/D-alanyl-D-alanine-endopeptidase [Nevskiaceae bacterium]TBR73591.1 MAG: D-alanyl-D-alanine carboxypeptidase/D-alanyl-D-alanine-endopeptidase [Nevskiaceae bacterium]